MISLIEISQENWNKCCSLSVTEDQKGYIASNAYSLAESKYEPGRYPLGIDKDGELVGFIMYGYDEEENTSWIIRFMIDKAYQNKGLGKEALKKLIDMLFDKNKKTDIKLCVEPDNKVAIKFYESFGFLPTGDKWGTELIYILQRED